MNRIAFWILAFAIVGIGYNAYHWFDGLTQNRIGYVLLKYGKDERRAYQFFKKSAEKGNSKGALNLGLCYVCGHGTGKDLEQAKKWISKSGRPEADKILKKLSQNSFDEKSGSNTMESYSKELLERAKNGDSVAQFKLAQVYENGLGTGKDNQKAFEYYQKAAKNGNPCAQNVIGYLYFQGINLSRDHSESFKWFEKSSLGNCEKGQCNLSKMYAAGLGTQRDDAKAFFWAKKSAEQNDSESQTLVGKFFLEGRGVSRNPELAVYWFRKAAENGDEDACLSLSSCYLTGTGVEKSLVESEKWKQRAELFSKP